MYLATVMILSFYINKHRNNILFMKIVQLNLYKYHHIRLLVSMNSLFPHPFELFRYDCFKYFTGLF